MSFLIPERIDQAEYLDLGMGTPQEVADNLAEMHATNRYLGGTRALLRHLLPRLQDQGREVSVLDIGTGNAGIPRDLLREALKLGLAVQVLGLDRSAQHLQCAVHSANGHPAVPLVCADAGRPPFGLRSVDFVISSLFLHHFSPQEVTTLLCEAFELAECGLVMTDLVRGRLPLAAFKLVQPVFARNYLTRHDGLLSIRRAYTPQELLGLAQAAGLRQARVYSHFPWRMTLVVDR